MLAPSQIRPRFPIFDKHPELVYLDSAATTQKPDTVIEGISRFYSEENANIHRGIYPLAARATSLFETSRNKVQAFIHAAKREEVIFTAGTTAGINLVANSFLGAQLQAGDNIVITAMEHHANLVPWQIACEKAGAELRIIPMDQQGTLILDAYQTLLDERTKLVALTHISNTLGTINPIAKLIEIAHQFNVPVLVDAAQSIAHYDIDVQALDCEFLVFSGHKLFGPTGIGVLYGKKDLLEKMSPYQYGGDMIRTVSFQKTTFANLPNKFEAGTPNIAGAIGLGYAIDFLNEVDRQQIRKHLDDIKTYATEVLSDIPGLHLVGNAANKTAIFSFTLDDIHPHDIATFLGEAGIAVRAGHHCTQPIMDFFELPATTRASFSIYNTKAEVNHLAKTIRSVQAFFNT